MSTAPNHTPASVPAQPAEPAEGHTDNLVASPYPAALRRAQLAARLPEAFSDVRLDVAGLKRALGEANLVEGGERYRTALARPSH